MKGARRKRRKIMCVSVRRAENTHTHTHTNIMRWGLQKQRKRGKLKQNWGRVN